MRKIFHLSKFGAMYYIKYRGKIYFSSRRRGLDDTFQKTSKLLESSSGKKLTHGHEDWEVYEHPGLINDLLRIYFSSKDFLRDKYFSFLFQTYSASELQILADIIICIDHNINRYVSRIDYDASGLTSTISFFEKGNNFFKLFFNDYKGNLVRSIPVRSIVGYVAEQTAITFKMQNGEFIQIAGDSDVCEDNFDQLFKANLVYQSPLEEHNNFVQEMENEVPIGGFNNHSQLESEDSLSKKHRIVTEAYDTHIHTPLHLTKKVINPATIEEKNEEFFITIYQSGWVYNVNEKRLYNTDTGENLYSSQGLGFSIGSDDFFLYNESVPRKISTSLVRYE